MRILFIIESLKCGGKERRIIELLKEMSLEYDIQLILMSEEIHYNEVYDLDIKIYKFKRNIFSDFLILRRFKIILDNFQPNIVNCWDNIAAIHFVLICNFKKITFINSMITSAPSKIPHFSKLYFINLFLFKFSDIILSNSQAGLISYNAPLKKSCVIRNGFNFERLKILESKKEVKSKLEIGNSKIIGMVASFSEKKDYETFIKAANLILKIKKDIVFVAIGDGPLLKHTKSLVKSEMQSNFRFLGKIDNVESYINIFDIAVLSTYSEGISNSILEYMSLSKPVIATDGGGTNELVINNQTGFLIEPRNHKKLSQKIIYLLNNNKMSIEMGLKGRRRIENEFSINKMISSTIDLFEKHRS